MKEHFRVAEATSLLKCHPDTVRRWDQCGLLKSQRNYLGHRVFRLADLLKFKQDRERNGFLGAE